MWPLGHQRFSSVERDNDLGEVGRKLKVKTVLEGSVRRSGQRLRVNAQLINAEDGYHLWSERYDRTMDDVFEVQDEIAQSVVDKLRVKLLGGAGTQLVKRPTDNLAAYTLYLKGRHYVTQLTGPALEKSLECFRQALEEEPDYAQAHAGVAFAETFRAGLSHVHPQRVIPAAKEAALRALSLDETTADAHVALATIVGLCEWDWAAAELKFRRALQLSPADSLARSLYADLLGRVGRTDLAVAEARRAVESDPLSSLSRYWLALILIMARKFDAAIAEAHTGIELDSNFHSLHNVLGWASAGLGRRDAAVEAFTQATVIAPGDTHSRGHLAWALGCAGHRAEALQLLTELEQQRSEEYVTGFVMAMANLGIGDHDAAIDWLERAADERDVLVTYLTWFPMDPLRADPRFQALLKKMNFPTTA